MTQRSKIALVGVLAAAVVALLIFRAVNIGNEARQEVARLFSQVTLGATKDEVARVFSANNFRRLRLVDVSNDLVLAQTPLEWGAGNWELRVELREGKVVAVKVRLLDDANIRPPSAPLDKTANGHATNL